MSGEVTRPSSHSSIPYPHLLQCQRWLTALGTLKKRGAPVVHRRVVTRPGAENDDLPPARGTARPGAVRANGHDRLAVIAASKIAARLRAGHAATLEEHLRCVAAGAGSLNHAAHVVLDGALPSDLLQRTKRDAAR